MAGLHAIQKLLAHVVMLLKRLKPDSLLDFYIAAPSAPAGPKTALTQEIWYDIPARCGEYGFEFPPEPTS